MKGKKRNVKRNLKNKRLIQKRNEEFYPIVDEIVEMITLEEFLSLTNEDKISRVRDLINNSRL